MAYGIQGYDNVEPPSADYPDGTPRDNDGSGNGTPANTKTHSDLHQFLAKIMREAGVVPNALPDNESNGWQAYEALIALMGGVRTKILPIGPWDMNAVADIVVAHGLDDADIREVNVLIRNDTDNTASPIFSVAQPAPTIDGGFAVLNTTIRLFRTTGGGFDNVAYQNITGGYNRGHIVIRYVE